MSIKYRKLDNNGDYSFGRGLQNFTYGQYAVKQAIQTRLKLLQGEWWENTKLGLPLFQKILGQRGTEENLKLADIEIKKIINDTQDVIGIESYDSRFENRELLFRAVVNTKYGQIDVTS